MLFAYFKAKAQEWKWRAEQYKKARQILESANNLVTEDIDANEWQSINTNPERVLSETEHATLQKQAYKLWKTNPMARCIINMHRAFIYGKGAEFQTVPSKNDPDKKIHKQVMDFWKNWYQQNQCRTKFREIVVRTLRDGECFIWWFEDNDKITFRFIDPDRITDTTHSYGIETDPDDVESVKAYYYRPAGEYDSQRIDASEIMHIKIGVDSNVKRGESILRPAMKYIAQYDQWLQDRIILNKIRSSVALIKKIQGTPAQIASLVTATRVSNSSEEKQQMFKPGSIVVASPGVEYKMESPNINASDVAEDGRRIQLMVATAVGLAEYMVTGDASNANYASTMVSESPAVRTFEDWQEFFAEYFEEIFQRIMRWAIRMGKLPAEAEEEIATVQVRFPPLLHRDFLEEVKGIVMLLESGLISHQTARGKLGFSHEDEEQRIKNEWEAIDDIDREFESARNQLLQE